MSFLNIVDDPNDELNDQHVIHIVFRVGLCRVHSWVESSPPHKIVEDQMTSQVTNTSFISFLLSAMLCTANSFRLSEVGSDPVMWSFT